MSYWVSMTDKFMSGWGAAEGKQSKLVIECETYQQACKIEFSAQERPEMIYINIRSTKPRYKKSRILTTFKHFNDLRGSWVS